MFMNYVALKTEEIDEIVSRYLQRDYSETFAYAYSTSGGGFTYNFPQEESFDREPDIRRIMEQYDDAWCTLADL